MSEERDFSGRTKNPMCTCNLEASFMATEPVLPGEPWEVLDAECETIGAFREQRYAELVAWALNQCSNNMQCTACRVCYPNLLVYEPPEAPPWEDGP